MFLRSAGTFTSVRLFASGFSWRAGGNLVSGFVTGAGDFFAAGGVTRDGDGGGGEGVRTGFDSPGIPEVRCVVASKTSWQLPQRTMPLAALR